ncbi:MAG: uroporphyrinogen decarboxylase family protein [Gemmatimonadota bacterium]
MSSLPRDSLTKRERVELALDRQPTDRVPLYDVLVHDRAIQHLTGEWPPFGEEGLRLRLQATARILDMTRMVGVAPQPPGDTTDAEGFVHYRQDPWIGGGIRQRPFADEAGARRWLEGKIRALQRPLDIDRFRRDYLAQLDKARAYLGDDTVIVQEYGPGLDWVRYSLGLELFSYLSVDAPQLITDYIRAYTDRELERIRATADARRSPCALPYGDIAYKGRLIHDPQWLRREFFPPLAEINRALHDCGVRCLFHSDGFLMEALPDLLAAGIDGLNPIETCAGMDLRQVKEEYGDRLFLTGGIDISQLMALAPADEVRRVCREAMAAASPGYFIGSTTELDNGSRLENILTMVETAWGRPLSPA